MPLYKTITVNPGIKVYIWKIEESEVELSKDVVVVPGGEARPGKTTATPLELGSELCGEGGLLPRRGELGGG